MAITRKNFTLHNIKRATIAYFRMFREWLTDKIPFLAKWLYQRHIREQVDLRLEAMSHHPEGKVCLETGECLCGCPVPALQYADDACEGGCYPPMMNKKEWKEFKTSKNLKIVIKKPK